jgi:hypothetical protein
LDACGFAGAAWTGGLVKISLEFADRELQTPDSVRRRVDSTGFDVLGEVRERD